MSPSPRPHAGTARLFPGKAALHAVHADVPEDGRERAHDQRRSRDIAGLRHPEATARIVVGGGISA